MEWRPPHPPLSPAADTFVTTSQARRHADFVVSRGDLGTVTAVTPGGHGPDARLYDAIASTGPATKSLPSLTTA